MDKKWLEPYIEQRSEEIKDIICKENEDFYYKHTNLIIKMKKRFPDLLMKELFEIEELFNQHITLAVDAYKIGFREGFDHK